MAKEEVQYLYDDIYHLKWLPGQAQKCPHPWVIEKYGIGGECVVSIYTCRKCRFRIEEDRLVYGGIICGYGKEEKT